MEIDLDRADRFRRTEGPLQPCGRCRAPASSKVRPIAYGLYFQWRALRRHAFLRGRLRLNQSPAGSPRLFFFPVVNRETGVKPARLRAAPRRRRRAADLPPAETPPRADAIGRQRR